MKTKLTIVTAKKTNKQDDLQIDKQKGLYGVTVPKKNQTKPDDNNQGNVDYKKTSLHIGTVEKTDTQDNLHINVQMRAFGVTVPTNLTTIVEYVK